MEQVETIGIALASGSLSLAVSWGMFKSKIDNLEQELSEHRSTLDHFSDKFVTLPEFKATTEPVKAQITEIQRDIKKILQMLIRNDSIRKD